MEHRILPVAGVDGEEPQTAAHRELLEETGCRAIKLALRDLFCTLCGHHVGDPRDVLQLKQSFGQSPSLMLGRSERS